MKIINKVNFLIPLTLAGSMCASAREHFNPALLDTSDSKMSGVDLSGFEQGNQAAGQYHVDVYINGKQIETRDIEFVLDQRTAELSPCISPDVFHAWGVKTEAYPELVQPPNPCVNLAAIPAAKADFRFNQQRLDLSIPQIALDSHARDYIAPDQWDDGINALSLNYNFSGSTTIPRHAGQSTQSTQYGNLHPGINIGPWRFRNYSTWSHEDGGTNQWDSVYNYVSRDIKILKSQLVIGDSSTPSDVFDSVPFRGVQLASDDDMIPDSLKGYAPVIRGIAKTHAEVSISQQGYTIYRASVAPGAFEINDLYPTGGSGDMEVTIKESDGTEQHILVPYASLPALRREGQLKYAATVGRSRTYGGKDADFGLLTAIYGLPFDVTAYGGVQWADIDYTALSAGIGHNLGNYGALSADVTQAWAKINPAHPDTENSQREKVSGQSVRVRYSKDIELTGTNFTIAGYRYSTSGYYSLPEALDRANGTDYDGRLRSRTEVSLSQDIVIGSLSLSYVNENYWDRSRMSSLGVGYSSSWNSISYGVNYSYNLNQNDDEGSHSGRRDDQMLSLNVSIPLDKFLAGSSVSYSMNTDNDGNTSQSMNLTGIALEDRNLNWSIQQGYSSPDQGNSGSAYANYKGRYAELNGGYAYDANSQRWSYGMRGGMLVHGEGLTLAQSLNDTIVLIDTQGASDVPVSNQYGIKTDAAGFAIVPYANPYHKNSVTLNTENLDNDDVELEQTSKSVIPSRGAVVVANYNTRIGRRALITLQREDGKGIPFGATVSSTSDEQSPDKQQGAIVGEGGQVYLTGLQDSGRLHVQWGREAGSSCFASYTLPDVKSIAGVEVIREKCN